MEGNKAMRKLAAFASAVAVLGVVAVSSTPSHAAVAGNMATAVESTNPLVKVGCYRLGEAGYRWYSACFGPGWLYPHHRVCRNGYCWYR
jgi:hypothetical protein